MEQPEVPPVSEKAKELIIKKSDEINNFNGHICDFTKLVFEISDITFNDIIAPNVECKKGCSHCCHVPVMVTAMEAFYIQTKTGRKANEIRRKKERTRKPDGSPCPFLKANSCSIYEFRPLACRTFASYDGEKECAKGGDNKHWMCNVDSSPIFQNSAMVLAKHSIDMAKKRQARYSDIRDWFNGK